MVAVLLMLRPLLVSKLGHCHFLRYFFFLINRKLAKHKHVYTYIYITCKRILFITYDIFIFKSTHIHTYPQYYNILYILIKYKIKFL